MRDFCSLPHPRCCRFRKFWCERHFHVIFVLCETLINLTFPRYQQASCGVALGVGLSLWDPDDANSKAVTLQWVGLLGDMFIRALKAIVLPLVFVNVIISVVDMMSLGRASSVGWKTLGLYTLTTLIASVIGLIAIVTFNGRFESKPYDEPSPAYVKLGCNENGEYLTELSDGTVLCLADGVAESDTRFIIDDISGTFQRVSEGARNDISLSDTIYDGVFSKLITSNIFGSFVESNFAAVIIFAIFAGVACKYTVYVEYICGMQLWNTTVATLTHTHAPDLFFVTCSGWSCLHAWYHNPGMFVGHGIDGHVRNVPCPY